MKDDGHDWYDHSTAEGRKMLMEVTGIVECRPPAKTDVMHDELGRPRLPRPRPYAMYDYCRGVPQLVSGTQEYMHWADMEASYTANPREERAEIVVCCQDNGSGFDPLSEVGAYLACKFAERHKLKMLVQCSPAAGESTLNFEESRH